VNADSGLLLSLECASGSPYVNTYKLLDFVAVKNLQLFSLYLMKMSKGQQYLQCHQLGFGTISVTGRQMEMF
jgi:hypothetical protein